MRESSGDSRKDNNSDKRTSDKRTSDKRSSDRRPSDRRSSVRRDWRQQKPLFVLIGAALLVLASVLIVKNTPTNRRMSDADYFGSMEEDEAALVLDSEMVPERAIVKDDAVYLPYSIVKERLNPRFYWDGDIGKMLFTTAYQEFEIPVNSASYSIIDGVRTTDPVSEGTYDRIILYRPEDGRITGESAEEGKEGNSTGLYVSVDFLQQYTQAEYTWEKDGSGDTEGHVLIRCQWGDTLTAKSVKEAAVRYQGGIKSPVLTTLQKGDTVIVLEELDHWMKVLTKDGYIGYVKSRRMAQPVTEEITTDLKAPEYPSIRMDGKVNLVWHQMTAEDGNDYLKDVTEGMTGVNVISPTWFSLKDNEGNITSIASEKYVKSAHKKKLQVWGLVSDFSGEMDTSAVLASTAARRNCIGQLTDLAEDLGLDGINLDFEYMEEPDAAAYVQFVRELSIECRRNELVLSVDMKPPYEFNKWMDRCEIGTVADYVINMGYDEHYSGSEAGSVASLPYEENAVSEYLSQGVPAEKLISAVPFYTRIWYSSENPDGTANTSSEVLSMGGVAQTLDSWNLTPVWDAGTSQHLADWTTEDGVRCRIWIEDEDSIAIKARLIPKYGLGGIAAWRLGFEDDGIWDVISENISLSQEEAEQADEEAEMRHEKEPQADMQTELPGSGMETETEA